MKLVRFCFEADEPHTGIVRNDEVVDIGIGDPLDLIDQVESSNLPEYEFLQAEYDLQRLPRKRFAELDNLISDKPYLLKPIVPPEIWACGVTYVRSRTARETETAAKGIYDRVYDAERPEIFFKATPHRCVGPNQPVHIRQDSKWSVPEPELAVVVGKGGRVLGFMAGNDMSARDIEGENPLYLPQAKVYDGCCSLGPALVTPTSIVNARDLTIKMSILRDGAVAYEGQANTSAMKRAVPELINFLSRNNPVPPGSVCLTGTGIVPPDDFSLMDNDFVEIAIDNIGTLRNVVKQL